MPLDIRSRRIVPSVQDFDRGKNPFVSLLEGGIQGWQQGSQIAKSIEERNRRRELAKTIVSQYPQLAGITNEDTAPEIAQRLSTNIAQNLNSQTDQTTPVYIGPTGEVKLQPETDMFGKLRDGWTKVPMSSTAAGQAVIGYLGKGQSGNVMPRGFDVETNQPVFSSSKKSGFFYADGTPYNGGKLDEYKKSKIPTSLVEQGIQIDQLSVPLENVERTYNRDLVGPVASRIGKASQYIEGTASPEASTFYSSLADIKNMIIYLRSGKQINEQEYERLTNALPDEGTSPTAFEERFKNFKQMYSEIINSRRKRLIQGGYMGTENNAGFNNLLQNNTNVTNETPEQRKMRLLKELSEAQ